MNSGECRHNWVQNFSGVSQMINAARNSLLRRLHNKSPEHSGEGGRNRQVEGHNIKSPPGDLLLFSHKAYSEILRRFYQGAGRRNSEESLYSLSLWHLRSHVQPLQIMSGDYTGFNACLKAVYVYCLYWNEKKLGANPRWPRVKSGVHPLLVTNMS